MLRTTLPLSTLQCRSVLEQLPERRYPTSPRRLCPRRCRGRPPRDARLGGGRRNGLDARASRTVRILGPDVAEDVDGESAIAGWEYVYLVVVTARGRGGSAGAGCARRVQEGKVGWYAVGDIKIRDNNGLSTYISIPPSRHKKRKIATYWLALTALIRECSLSERGWPLKRRRSLIKKALVPTVGAMREACDKDI